MESGHRLSSTEWDAIFAAQAQSGMSVQRFCLSRGIKPTSFYSAQKRKKALQFKGLEAADRSMQALEPSPQPAPIVASLPEPGGFVALHISEESGAKLYSGAAAIRVMLRGGHQLWVGPDFESVHLRRLVITLESAS